MDKPKRTSRSVNKYQCFEHLRTLGDSEGVYSIAISPDGKTIISGSDNNTIKVWELKQEPWCGLLTVRVMRLIH